MKLSPPLQQIERTFVRHRGRKLIYFGGCDYLRLSWRPAVLKALQQGLNEYGLTVSASRLTTGNHVLYERLEQQLAEFFQVEAAVLMASGYVTNLVLAQALAGEFTHAFIDARAHPSLRDAASWLGCPVTPFKHRDTADLARQWQAAAKPAKALVLTDGMFAHDGEIAPLDRYLKTLPAQCFLLVDDAHGAGILGPTGRGTVEYLGLPRRRILQTITLSKALGVYGGAVLGPRWLERAIQARSAMFLGQTPLPLPLACAGLKALAICRSDPSLRQRLNDNTHFVQTALREAGIETVDTPSPIIQIVPRGPTETRRLQQKLLAHAIYPTLIRYPGGPPTGYFRFAISSEHTRAQLTRLVQALTSFRP